MKRTAAEIVTKLTEKLWKQFLSRVPYAITYTDMIERKGGRVVLDHIGFRTLNTHMGEQPAGIQAIKHIFDCFGYYTANKYILPKKRLKAVSFEPKNAWLPKIFVSQLDVQQLPDWAQHLLPGILDETPYPLTDAGIELLGKLKEDGILTSEAAGILEDELVKYFKRPWVAPSKDAILKMNDVSHYAAWVLLHGNSPSHFAVLINEQNVASLPDLTTTCDLLKQHGLPLKETIEGTNGGLLQQSATFAIKEDVQVRGETDSETILWTYAYLEFIERGFIEEENHRVLFQGFIESQEQHLYNMTRTLDN